MTAKKIKMKNSVETAKKSCLFYLIEKLVFNIKSE